MNMFYRILFTCSLIFLYACQTPDIGVGTVETSYNWNRNLRVAIIPFENDDKDLSLKHRRIISKKFYAEFYKSFSLLNYKNIDFILIQNYMKKYNLKTRDIIISPKLLQKFNKDLQVDIVVTCHIKKQTYINSLFYEYWKSNLHCFVWDTNSTKLIYNKFFSETEHRWHFTISPFGAAGKIIDVLIRDPVYDTVVRNVCNTVVNDIPNPKYILDPKIFLISRQPYDKTLIKGDEVTIQVKATPHLNLTYKLSNQKKFKSFNEVKRGIYTAQFKVNNETPNGKISIFVIGKDIIGNSTKLAEFKNALTVDTHPPGTPQNFNIFVDKGAIWLNWKGHTPKDFKNWLIYRKCEIEKMFSKIAVVTKKSFLDTNIKPFHKYQYKICAVDKLGNRSQFSSIEEDIWIKKGPFYLDEKIRFIPTTFYKDASPYILKGYITIPKGVSLTIEPGTIINVNQGGIKINGAININGTSSLPILFSNINNNRSVCLNFSEDSKGNIVNAEFRNFATAIQATKSKIIILDTAFRNSEQAIILKNKSECNIKNSIFKKNNYGIKLLDKSKLNIETSNFLDNFSNINITQNSIANLENNWWGQFPKKQSNKLLKINGDVDIKSILSESYPKGFLVNVSCLEIINKFNKEKNYKTKIGLCKKIIKKSPYYVAPYIWLVNLLNKSKCHKEAILIINKLLKIYPNNKEIIDIKHNVLHQ